VHFVTKQSWHDVAFTIPVARARHSPFESVTARAFGGGALVASPLAGQDAIRQMEIHGYGGWGFGRLSSNDSTSFYAFAHRRGDYSHSELALDIPLPVNERVTRATC
jgi:hypothetical protein